MMSTTAPLTAEKPRVWTDFEYLLLGDLRQILDEPASSLRDRWLVSLLDVLLASCRKTHDSSIVNTIVSEAFGSGNSARPSSQALGVSVISQGEGWSGSRLNPQSLTEPMFGRNFVNSVESLTVQNDPQEALLVERIALCGKLQRLRDRVAHRTPFNLLANEVRCDLQDLIEADLAS